MRKLPDHIWNSLFHHVWGETWHIQKEDYERMCLTCSCFEMLFRDEGNLEMAAFVQLYLENPFCSVFNTSAGTLGSLRLVNYSTRYHRFPPWHQNRMTWVVANTLLITCSIAVLTLKLQIFNFCLCFNSL